MGGCQSRCNQRHVTSAESAVIESTECTLEVTLISFISDSNISDTSGVNTSLWRCEISLKLIALSLSLSLFISVVWIGLA